MADEAEQADTLPQGAQRRRTTRTAPRVQFPRQVTLACAARLAAHVRAQRRHGGRLGQELPASSCPYTMWCNSGALQQRRVTTAACCNKDILQQRRVATAACCNSDILQQRRVATVMAAARSIRRSSNFSSKSWRSAIRASHAAPFSLIQVCESVEEYESIVELIDDLDENGDNEVDFAEFKQM